MPRDQPCGPRQTLVHDDRPGERCRILGQVCVQRGLGPFRQRVREKGLSGHWKAFQQGVHWDRSRSQRGRACLDWRSDLVASLSEEKGFWFWRQQRYADVQGLRDQLQVEGEKRTLRRLVNVFGYPSAPFFEGPFIALQTEGGQETSHFLTYCRSDPAGFGLCVSQVLRVLPPAGPEVHAVRCVQV